MLAVLNCYLDWYPMAEYVGTVVNGATTSGLCDPPTISLLLVVIPWRSMYGTHMLFAVLVVPSSQPRPEYPPRSGMAV